MYEYCGKKYLGLLLRQIGDLSQIQSNCSTILGTIGRLFVVVWRPYMHYFPNVELFFQAWTFGRMKVACGRSCDESLLNESCGSRVTSLFEIWAYVLAVYLNLGPKSTTLFAICAL